ncbi:MAG: SpoIIE family protein phosphatase [Clostridia bacterium]
MFQNIARDFDDEQNQNEDVEFHRKRTIKEVIQNCFTKQAIIVYVLSFMLSLVGFGKDSSIAPFGIAMLAAILGNGIPIGISTILVGIGTFLSYGGNSTLNLLLIVLLLTFSILIKAPKYQAEANEKRKLGLRLFVIGFLVQAGNMFFRDFLVYDLLVSFMYSISAYIFYKIFVNSMSVVTKLGEKNVCSIEEVMGASLLVTIALCALGQTSIFGYTLRNIACILIVLVMGWKHGILVGGTAGITIGAVLGIIGNSEPIMIASYALSGMIAGIFNHFGKIGVILGFILGNIGITYCFNGQTQSIIMMQEIMIASLGLLAIPKNIGIDIEDRIGNTKLLPTSTGHNLEENKQTIYKLNSMSETISEIARTYQEAAATVVEEEEIEKQEQDNESIFERELQNNLEGYEENILFEDLYTPEEDLLKDIFTTLLQKEKLSRKDLLSIFAKHNNYIVGLDDSYVNDSIEDDVGRMVKIINESYKMSKINFIWKKKLQENQKAVSNQLEEVSKAIGALADEMETIEEDPFAEEQEEIKTLLEQKEIFISKVNIKKEKTGRMEVTLYTPVCENVEKPTCDIKKMSKIISKILEQNMIIQKQECGFRNHQTECSYTFLSEDKQTVQIGVAKATKKGSAMSGDTCVQTRLADGKYLLAISDGMGSGKEARRSSKMAIGMLEKLLSSGFDKDTSLRLINSTLTASHQGEDMYATLDIGILDLYAGNLEFIKNAACPTYIKNKRNVQILKSIALPTGILTDIDLVVYDRDLQDGDIIVMCSDGILESSSEYTNKELWLQFLLEEIETQDVQKIADIILQEAIDNDYGVEKDDMTVMVAKIKNKA